jgi:hypothetical protein
MSALAVGSLLVVYDPAPCLVLACDGQTIGPNIGTVLYSGEVPVVAIAPYKKGIFTAFGNNRITWSSDGTNLSNGAEVYRGASPITAMIAYRGGILTAFSNTGHGHRIHWTPEAADPATMRLGAGPIVYDGSSIVVAMTTILSPGENYHGVFTAFARPNVIHYASPAADVASMSLGGGPKVYSGSSPIVAMTTLVEPDRQSVFTGFTHAGDFGNRIHWSNYGVASQLSLGGGNPPYDGSSPVLAIVQFQKGLLTAFAAGGCRVHWQEGLNKPGSSAADIRPGAGPVRYQGDQRIRTMVVL